MRCAEALEMPNSTPKCLATHSMKWQHVEFQRNSLAYAICIISLSHIGKFFSSFFYKFWVVLSPFDGHTTWVVAWRCIGQDFMVRQGGTMAHHGTMNVAPVWKLWKGCVPGISRGPLRCCSSHHDPVCARSRAMYASSSKKLTELLHICQLCFSYADARKNTSVWWILSPISADIW